MCELFIFIPTADEDIILRMTIQIKSWYLKSNEDGDRDSISLHVQ